MGVRDYGIWKGTAVLSEFEDRYEDHDSPHLSLYYHDNEGDPPDLDRDFRRNNRGHPPNPNRPKEIPGLFRATINIKSTDYETRLAYWVNNNIEDHPIVQKLTGLDFGFNPINSLPEFNGQGLDYIRGNLFNSRSGRVLVHDIPGTNNDIIDVLEPEITKAVEKKATIYLFGSRFNTKNGIHNVHMNQGNIKHFTRDDGVFQDGGLLIQYENHWTGIFIAFASQAIHTDDDTGHKIPGNTLTWGDFLLRDIEENSVSITKALINPRGRDDSSTRDKESVTLGNFTNRQVSLSSWTLRNSAGNVQELPQNAVLDAGESKDFDVPNCPLGNNGDTITLRNKEGLRVDGVSYRRRPGHTEGHPIVFAQGDAEEANTGLWWDSPRSEYGFETMTGRNKAAPDIKEKIRSDILDGINPQTQELFGTFKLDWDPLSFVKEQRYAKHAERPGEALERAITLTGCANDAQAETAGAYLNQTWPDTGKHVMQLVVDATNNTTEDHVIVNLPDGTGLDAHIDGGKFIVTTTGTAGHIAEIAQQLAWLGAALRSSRFETGVALCSPLFHYTLAEDREPAPPGPTSMPRAKISCQIGFRMRELAMGGEELPGQCWHKIFRNPVLVSGYPIPAKPKGRLGLEIPLNMMAGLTGSEWANNYGGKILIKGFSSMLVATTIVEDLIIWHHYYVDGESRISYNDTTLAGVDGIGLAQLDAPTRHVVGWCSNCEYKAGASDAQYDLIRGSELPAPHAGCILQNVSISGGKFITAGATIAIGVKDVPPHLSRDGYILKLNWIATKYVVLWDEQDKRGWLINGAAALLHLVRTSLQHYRSGEHPSPPLFEPAEMKNADDYKPDSARNVLVDSNNRGLKIWLDKTEIFEEETHGAEASKIIKTKRTYYLFEDLVGQHFNILEQIMDHHTRQARTPGVNLKLRWRNHLEGWDFIELAKDSDPLPRVATLKSFGDGWVDLVCSIDAITLFGRGFGDIIGPTNFDGMCPTWENLPKGNYYLAASVFDLKAIVKVFGDERVNPPRRVVLCQCQKDGASNTRGPLKHHNPVQTHHKSHGWFSTTQGPPDKLEDGGAVIFTHSFTWG